MAVTPGQIPALAPPVEIFTVGKLRRVIFCVVVPVQPLASVPVRVYVAVAVGVKAVPSITLFVHV